VLFAGGVDAGARRRSDLARFVGTCTPSG
jgi:hypothetical protein